MLARESPLAGMIARRANERGADRLSDERKALGVGRQTTASPLYSLGNEMSIACDWMLQTWGKCPPAGEEPAAGPLLQAGDSQHQLRQVDPHHSGRGHQDAERLHPRGHGDL